jgi:hypothetical protein
MFKSLDEWWNGTPKKAEKAVKPLINALEVGELVKTGRRAWVIIPDGRIAYIDHYKADGNFGVRPIVFETGLHYPNTSAHWSEEQRNSVPEEFALPFSQMVPATEKEIPSMYRGD